MENTFDTKMLLKEFDLKEYLFGQGIENFSEQKLDTIESDLKQEMQEIFYSRNFSK